MHIAKCNIVIDTYLFKKKLARYPRYDCKTISHAYEHKLQNQYMKEMLSKAFDTKQTTQTFLINIKKMI